MAQHKPIEDEHLMASRMRKLQLAMQAGVLDQDIPVDSRRVLGASIGIRTDDCFRS